LVIAIVPITKQRSRAYLGYPTTTDGLLVQGNDKLGTFMKESQKVAPNLCESYAQAKGAGPLAAFEVGESWVEHPYHNGVALLGDAASTSDPTFGQGMATTLRDARVLRDALLADSDWDQAGHEYARCHDVYFQNEYKVCGWLRTMFQDRAHGPKRSGNAPCRELRKVYPESQIICSAARTYLWMIRYARGFLASADARCSQRFGT
jgi:2-polyprenyl-6-methoxyphenol hydroxylase-like FAD-dependent oxidoreductase